MRNKLLFILFIFSVASVFSEELFEDKLEEVQEFLIQAENSDDSAVLEEAYKKFTGLAAEYPESAALLYNTGLVCNIMGKKGEAVYFLKRAEKLDPANSKIQMALDSILGEINIAYQENKARKVLTWIFPLHFFTSTGVRVVLLLLSISLALMFLVLLKSNKVFKFSGVALLLFAVFFSVSVIVDYTAIKNEAVLAENQEAFAGNSSFFVKRYDNLLPAGTVVKMYKESKGWCYVKTPDGSKCWIRKDGIFLLD
jgi:tetratricopeptide (TPR) repeat protein